MCWCFSDLPPKELETLLGRSNNGLNDFSVTRRRKLLAQRTGIEPDQNELRVLRHRDDVAHSGYIIDTSYDEALTPPEDRTQARSYASRLSDLIRDEAVYRDFVTRTLLRLISYEGSYVDAKDGSARLLEHA